jgi:hypothetical protein
MTPPAASGVGRAGVNVIAGYCSFLVRYWPRDDGERLLVEQIQTGERIVVGTPREAADWIGQQAAAQSPRASATPAPANATTALGADAAPDAVRRPSSGDC